MAREIVPEDSEALCRSGQLSESAAQILLQRPIRVECALSRLERPPRFLQGLACHGDELCVQSFHQHVRALQCAVERLERLSKIHYNLIERQLLNLHGNVPERRLQLLQAAMDGGQLRRRLGPIYFGLRRIREKV